MRGACDEILIIKDGHITDTSISNIVFRLPDGWWLTPFTPLLKGIMRTYLLESGPAIQMDRILPLYPGIPDSLSYLLWQILTFPGCTIFPE